MRPTFLFSCIIFIIMSFSFCTKMFDDNNIPTLVHHNGYLEDTISAESTTLSNPFLFTATESWTAVSSDDSWLTVNTPKGEAKKQISLHISTKKNTKTKTRRASILVKTVQDSFSLYIIQLADGSLPTEGNGTLVYDNNYDLEQSIYADATTLNEDFVFTATESWTAVSSDDSWLKVVSPKGDEGRDISLDVLISINTTEAERTATITLSTSTSKDEVILTVKQLATDEDGNIINTIEYGDYNLDQSISADDETLNEDFVFKARESWTAVSSDDSWLIVNISNGEAKERITLGISTKKNETTTERTATITLSTSKDEVVLDEVVLTVTQLGKSHIIVSSPQASDEIEGFRKNKIDVKAYDGGGGGHDAESGGGGYVIHNFNETKTVYIPYNITLANPEDYTWKATSSFNLKDAGLVSSVNYIDDANTDKEKHVTGDDGEGVYLFVDVTGPGDEDITGTLTIETVLKDESNLNQKVYKKEFKLTIITSCGIGETTTASLVWDDRNRGVHVPDKAVGSVAGYFTNADDKLLGGEGHKYPEYKGDYYEWKDAKDECSSIGDGWYLPTRTEFTTLVATDLRFSKTRAFVVSDAKSDVYPYYYTGAWFPLAGWVRGSGFVYGYYWSSTVLNSSSTAYILLLGPTSGSTSDDEKTLGFSVRCVKTLRKGVN